MKKALIALVAIACSACASASVQNMSRSTFQVSTTAAPVCGMKGAMAISQRVAAIEVIRRGGDRFIITSADSQRSLNGFVAGAAMQRNNQGVIVKMVSAGDPEFDEALSARELLGDNWEKQVRRGKPSIC